jgi:hypothetical protein
MNYFKIKLISMGERNMKKVMFVFVGIILFNFNVFSKTIINLPSQYSTIEVALTNNSTTQQLNNSTTQQLNNSI